MSYVSREASSYYLLKDQYDKGLFKRRSDLIGSQVYEYHTALKVLTDLGFLKKVNSEYYLKDLSDMELMLFINELEKEIIIKNDNKTKVRRKKAELKENIVLESINPEKESNEYVSDNEDFNSRIFKSVSVLEMKLNISDYSDEEILAELKKRGYEGELYVVKKQKINL
jgi:hypothetical protein